MSESRPAVIDVLEPGYGPLFDRAMAVFGGDERVRAVWLAGSLARGTADAASDLDLLVAVEDRALDAFAAEWEAWLAAITPTVIAKPLPFLPGSLYSVTPGRERLDVIVEPVSAVATSGFTPRLVVLDRDGLDAQVPDTRSPAGPSPDAVAGLVEEYLRDIGMFPVVVLRQDWLLGVEAVHRVRSLLYQLFVEANAPLPPSGVKQWSAKLTADQRGVLEGLPGVVTTDRAGVVPAHEAAACAFIRAARPICDRLGVPWPQALEDATRTYLRSHGLPALDGCEEHA